MTVTFERFASVAENHYNQTVWEWEHEIGAGEGRLLFVSISTGEVGAPDGTVAPTANGQPLTFLTHVASTEGSEYHFELWYMVDPPVGTIEMVWNRGMNVQLGLVNSLSFQGVDPASLLVEPELNTGATTSMITVDSVVDGLVLDFLQQYGHEVASRHLVPDESQTLVMSNDFGRTENSGPAIDASIKPGDDSVTMAWANAGGFMAFIHVAIPLAPLASEPDEPQPEIDIHTPNGLTLTAGTKVVLEATASEGTPPYSVAWYLGAVAPENKIDDGESVVWDTTGLAQGQYTVIAHVEDDNEQTTTAQIQVGIGEPVTPTAPQREELRVMATFALREPDATRRTVPLYITDSQGDGVTGITGPAQIKKANGTFTNSSANLVSRGNGFYDLTLTQAELDTLGALVVRYANGANRGTTYCEVVPEPLVVTGSITSASSATAAVIASGLSIKPGWVFQMSDGPAAGSTATVVSYTGTTITFAEPGFSATPTAGNNFLAYAAPPASPISGGGATAEEVRLEIENNSQWVNTISTINTATQRIPAQPAAVGDIPTVQDIGTYLDNNSLLSNMDMKASQIAAGDIDPDLIADATVEKMDTESQQLQIIATNTAGLENLINSVLTRLEQRLQADLVAINGATTIDGKTLLEVAVNEARILLGNRTGTGTSLEVFRALDGSAKQVQVSLDASSNRNITLGAV